MQLFLVFLINEIQSEGNNQGNLFQLAFPSHEFKTDTCSSRVFFEQNEKQNKKNYTVFQKKKIISVTVCSKTVLEETSRFKNSVCLNKC